MDKIVDLIIPSAVVLFLNTTLYENPFIIFNYWSIIHFIKGIIVYRLFPNKFKEFFIFEIVFEIFEYILAFGGNPLFVEEFLDTLWDIILGLLGFIVYNSISLLRLLLKKK